MVVTKSGKDSASLVATISTASQPESLMTRMVLPFQSDGCKAAADTSNWMFSVTKREASENEFVIDPGAATSVSHLTDSLGGKPSGAGVQLRSAT